MNLNIGLICLWYKSSKILFHKRSFVVKILSKGDEAKGIRDALLPVYKSKWFDVFQVVFNHFKTFEERILFWSTFLKLNHSFDYEKYSINLQMKKMRFRNVILCICTTIGFQKHYHEFFYTSLNPGANWNKKHRKAKLNIFFSNPSLSTCSSSLNLYMKLRWDQIVEFIQIIVSLIWSKHLYSKCFKRNTEFLFLLTVIFFFFRFSSWSCLKLNCR